MVSLAGHHPHCGLIGGCPGSFCRLPLLLLQEVSTVQTAGGYAGLSLLEGEKMKNWQNLLPDTVWV